jgi:diacylglycerol kinase family enzyme
MLEREVVSREYKIVAKWEAGTIYTKDLNVEVAICICSQRLEKTAMGRNLTPENLAKLFTELNPDNIIENSLFDVMIVGGLPSEETEEYCKKLLNALQKIDNNTNIIDIISYDVGVKPHPNSIKLNCFNGEVYSLEKSQLNMFYEEL